MTSADNRHKQYNNISETWNHNEGRPSEVSHDPRTADNIADRDREREEYWDRITEDAATGYGAERGREQAGRDSQLNPDQEPGDEQFGDS